MRVAGNGQHTTLQGAAVSVQQLAWMHSLCSGWVTGGPGTVAHQAMHLAAGDSSANPAASLHLCWCVVAAWQHWLHLLTMH